MSDPAEESGEVLDGEDARVLANTLRMANETATQLLAERNALREVITGLLRMMRPEWIPDAQQEARRALERSG